MHLKALGIAVVACALVAALLAGNGAGAAEVRVGTLVLRADGGFQPQAMPKHRRVPIRFQGWAKIRTTNRTVPPAVRHVQLEFDRDGLVTTAGLPTCAPSRIQATTVVEARRRCRGAIVGTGKVSATISLLGARLSVSSPLTLFNGPRRDGHITVVGHAQTTVPILESYVVVAPLEKKRRGTFGYRTRFEIPKIAGGLGALTDVQAKIGREYRHRGAKRSYVTARCSTSILQTYGIFRFEDGNVIAGSVYKGCRQLP